MNDLGPRIRAARAYAGLKRSDLAAKLQISEATLKRLESGWHRRERPDYQDAALLKAVVEACELPQNLAAEIRRNGAH